MAKLLCGGLRGGLRCIVFGTGKETWDGIMSMRIFHWELQGSILVRLIWIDFRVNLMRSSGGSENVYIIARSWDNGSH